MCSPLSPVRLLGIALSLSASLPLTTAAPNMVPDYEVKLLLQPTAVLGSDNKLLPTVLSAFAMSTSVIKMNVQFVDDDNKTIYNAGWSPRIRKMEGEDKIELTYKKRYPVTGSDIVRGPRGLCTLFVVLCWLEKRLGNSPQGLS